MPILTTSSFRPAWWLSHPHLQTLWPALLRSSPTLARTRERLHTPDGDFLDLDWHGKKHHAIVMLLHGLSGSSNSTYILGMQQELLRKGFCSVGMNFRGCSGQPNNTARCYHSGDTDDVDFLFRHLRKAYPHMPIAVVGYSLGGNVLLKWLGEGRQNLDIFAAAAVSVPLLLNKCSSRMDVGFSKRYRNQLLKELKGYIYSKHNHLRSIGQPHEADKLQQLGDLTPISSFWEYDDRVIAGLYPFTDVNDYYAQSSSRQYLKSINTPTLIIHANDDPFMTPEVIPSESELSPSVDFEIAASGGHVGFVAGNIPGRPRYWLEERIPHFIQQHYKRLHKG